MELILAGFFLSGGEENVSVSDGDSFSLGFFAPHPSLWSELGEFWLTVSFRSNRTTRPPLSPVAK